MQIDHQARPARRIHSRLALAAAGLLLLALTLAPVALGRATAARHSSCKSGTHARHASHTSRCGKHHKAKHAKKGSSHKPGSKSGSHKTASRVPLRCEDGTLPVREGPEEFTCDDESTPSCPDGFEAQLSADGETLTCSAGLEAKEEVPAGEVCEVSGEEEAASCALNEEEES